MSEDTPMNTDDRALADLIAELRAACDADDARHDGSLLKGFAHHVKSADLRTILDRLEAFHAKPVAGRWPDRESIADAFLLSPHRVQNGDRQHANPADYIEYIRTYKSASLGEARRVADFVLSLPGALAALQSPPPVVSGEADMRAVVEALGFDPTNHHNAAKCPYCTPEPAVEEGRREAVAWQPVEDAIFEGLDANIACTQNKVRDLAKLLTARVFAILALPHVEGVGEGRYRAYRDHVLDADSLNTFQVVPVNRTDGDSLAISVAEAMNAALFTPVAAQGDEVREALEPFAMAGKWMDPSLLTCPDDATPWIERYPKGSRLLTYGDFRRAAKVFATLGAPHEG